MNITPIYCPDSGCFWSAHGIPDQYTEARDWHLAAHRAEEHGEPLTEEQLAYATRAGHVIPGSARTTAAAVAALGALPMLVGPEPQESDTFRFTLYIEGATDREDASWAAEQAVSAVEGQGYKAFTAVAAEDAHYRAAFEAQQARAETLDRLLRTAQDRVAELETEREKLVRWHGEDSKAINRLVARVERHRARLVALQNDALNIRGSLAPADGSRAVPFELGETLTPAVDWLIARVAELEENLRAVNAGWGVARARVAEMEARLDVVHRVPQDNVTPAEVRLGQYSERTKTWSTATYDSGTERALHEIACGLRDALEEVRDQRNAARLKVMGLEARLAEHERLAGTYPSALPWAKLMDHEDLTDFLDELAASAITHVTSEVALDEVESTIARWRAIGEAQHAHNTAPGPDEPDEDRPGMRHAVRTTIPTAQEAS